ncbi:hypothetical protein E8E14_008648 [Neopestalotiopsis sp. 37M]|nr:hypothetical protein E8E14_008648 [Neopestalotiopsis sp. 37M]
MAPDSTRPDLPPLKDLTIENITENVHSINSRCEDARLKFLLETLVTHLHDFARETRLSVKEWETAIEFLVQVGQISSDVRHEFILLSDILGLSLLVDSIDHPKPPNSTEGTVLGPFHTLEAHDLASGDQISHDPDGEPLFVLCSIKDTQGRPLEGVSVDVWETDSKGFYDVQYAERSGPDGRAVLQSDQEGIFYFKAIVPVPYPIPNDGPVGKLLGRLKRHPYRPSHMHFMFKKPGYDRLITALYLRGDPYENSDAVFGVKESLITTLGSVSDVEGLTEKYGVAPTTKLLKHDFVLITDEESDNLREQNAWKEAQRRGGLTVKDGLLSMDNAAELVNAPNFGGASVTMPHKLEAHKFCQEQTESARLIGAINTLIVNEADDGKRKIIGDNTDWSGLYSIITTHYDETGIEPPQAGLVIGAGGAARAALYAIHRSGIQHIYLVNRTIPNAEKVKDAFSSSFDITVLPDLQQLPQSPGVIIGTVPAETTCENEFHQLFSSDGGLCIEMSYKPPHTPLMAAAERHAGWRTLSGVDVLLAQAFDQFRLWTGLEPPKAQMIEAVRQHAEK